MSGDPQDAESPARRRSAHTGWPTDARSRRRTRPPRRRREPIGQRMSSRSPVPFEQCAPGLLEIGAAAAMLVGTGPGEASRSTSEARSEPGRRRGVRRLWPQSAHADAEPPATAAAWRLPGAFRARGQGSSIRPFAAHQKNCPSRGPVMRSGESLGHKRPLCDPSARTPRFSRSVSLPERPGEVLACAPATLLAPPAAVGACSAAARSRKAARRQPATSACARSRPSTPTPAARSSQRPSPQLARVPRPSDRDLSAHSGARPGAVGPCLSRATARRDIDRRAHDGVMETGPAEVEIDSRLPPPGRPLRRPHPTAPPAHQQRRVTQPARPASSKNAGLARHRADPSEEALLEASGERPASRSPRTRPRARRRQSSRQLEQCKGLACLGR